MNHRFNAIYARQSVDKKDSISIESQIEFCRFELQGDSCREYVDRGYSGKNTDRPNFQELIGDIKRGLISKVVVYKLDRISRSILDFSNMMELFQEHNVEFVSSTEKFDTSTPMGRAMLNICIVFAQLERETIQKRITDAYYSRGQKGFRMGGKPPYGFHAEPIVLDGIHTKKLVVNPEEAGHVRTMFELYAQPQVSYGDITRQFTCSGILFHGKELSRATLAQMLRNPVYVRADQAIYDFFQSQGAVLVNDPEEFAGVNGCYLYQGREAKGNKLRDLNGQLLVLAPHAGFVPAELWLKCRKKLMNNMKIQSARKATHTWLAGKIKCGNCGYALTSVTGRTGVQYLRCTKRLDNKSCVGCGKIRTAELEQRIFQEMAEKVRLIQREGQASGAGNPRMAALQSERIRVEQEIERLVDALAQANSVLLSYVNARVAELDGRRQELSREISQLNAEAVAPETVEELARQLGAWEDVDFGDKRMTVDLLISSIRATSETLCIDWKI
ncbi:recombinase family protein [Oscillibacter hominis]|uniref:Recombinase family protein n=1 Tax=Oscillibacter hominis TaxID=2763056 RepID=A0A7G9B8N2_9FIRM|nr:recombinase family protein [Oscillibacter hominis]QNL45913.1 recombinase family protein [Oscillibacter hominis]